MHSTIGAWIDDLVDVVNDAQASAAFQEWLDVQSRFHDYSYRNTLIIKRQCPEATRVAGYLTWQEEFHRWDTQRSHHRNRPVHVWYGPAPAGR